MVKDFKENIVMSKNGGITMVTAASLAGNQKFGLGWHKQIFIDLPLNIPELFEQCDTNYDVIKLAYDICSKLIKKLENILPSLSKDCRENLREIIEQMKDSFIWDDIKMAESYDDLNELANGLDKELLYQLNDLYDWADYFRILLINNYE